DDFMMKIMFGHWLLAVAVVSWAHGFFLTGVLGGAAITLLAWCAKRLLPGTVYSGMVFGICLMLFSALYIQQGLGRIEWHFHIFAALAFLLRYKDIRPLLAAVVTVAVHHLVMNICQSLGLTVFGMPITVFDYGTGFGIVFLHAAFVIFEALVLGYIIFDLTEQFCQRSSEADQNSQVLDVLEQVITKREVAVTLSEEHPQAHVVNTLLAIIKSGISTRVGFDNASVAMVFTDEAGAVVYLNKAAKQLITDLAPSYERIGEHHREGQLVGTPVKSLLGSEASVADAVGTGRRFETRVDARTLDVVASPVVGDNGQSLGAIFELVDRTEQRNVEAQLSEIVSAASVGDLSRRIEYAGRGGFVDTLAGGVNQLISVSDELVQDCSTVLRALSTGDLTQQVAKDYQGQFGDLTRNLNNTIVKLTGTVSGIQNGATHVERGAQGIAGSNADLTTRMHQKASNIKQTAARMEELTVTVRENAEHAVAANDLAVEARDQAVHGGGVVNRAVDAMSAISDASKKVTEITGVINEIAFQTNLLARAGEHGRGFAVVASEVRNLAARSATAAKEINVLIGDSVTKVAEGAALVDESGKTLGSIVESVQKASDVVAQITEASQSQYHSIETINGAIAELESLTRQNTSLVENAAAASQRMGEEARSLASLVDAFSLDRDAPARPARENPLVSVG
ncbi:MAG: methyl-accepting chemotaxis protein, partial [Pseudomonadota bacterium]